MSAKKCCCCGLLSCFPCFSDKKSTLSAQPDSSEIAAPPHTVITNPSPAATLSSAPSHQLSSSAPPSAVAPSQVNASTVMQNDSQPTAASDAVPSSSRGIVTPSALIPTTSQTTASPPTHPPSSSTPSSLIPTTSQTTASPPTQPPSSSTASSLIPPTSQTTASPPTQSPSSSIPSSSRLPKESDYAETIMEAAKELDKENVDGDFSDLINYISRLFDFIEELRRVKGIWCSDNSDPIYIPAEKLELMSGSLRVLQLGHSTYVKGKCGSIFKELVLFSAGISHLPFDVSKLKRFEKLSYLCYNPEDLPNLSQMPSSLRHIEFELNSPAFKITSNCLQQVRNLRVLRMTNAHFKNLPQELGHLVNGLQELRFSVCEYLEELPESISTLGSLRGLWMRSCPCLKRLPEDFGSLNSLQFLYLLDCRSLKALPSSLENLTSLQELCLYGCESLKALPVSLGKLTSLQELSLYECDSLETLPHSLEKLSSLKDLVITSRSIQVLPSGIGNLTSLVSLCLCCSKLSSIPESIGQSKLLNRISLSARVKELPDGFCNLSSLTYCDMGDCAHLEKLPDRFGQLTNLRSLMLDRCESLKKLPESFSQLKCLEHLSLKDCAILEELCTDFKDLSSLRVLLLNDCKMLKKLPQDFHCLVKLEVLEVRNCRVLEGKWMDSLVKMKTLQIVKIGGSPLAERWGEIEKQCDPSWTIAVHTGQGLSNKENIAKQLQPNFDSILTDRRGRPFHISDLPLNTPLLVMFDAGKESILKRFLFSFIEENIDDIQINFEIVYFGNHFNEFPEKLLYKVLGHGPADSTAEALSQKLLSLDLEKAPGISWRCSYMDFLAFSAKIVHDEKGDKYLSGWELLKQELMEEFIIKKCGSYLKLKQLVERPRESPIELLRELFKSAENESSLGFLKEGAPTQVGLDEVKEKTILLDIRPTDLCYDVPLQSLVEMYVEVKEKGIFDFEIITIPITQPNTNWWDKSEKFSREVPWLVLQNTWQLTNATKFFLVEGRWEERPRGSTAWPRGWEQWPVGLDRWYPNIMRLLQSNGTFAGRNPIGVLLMVNTWGIEAFPFTEGKSKKHIEKEVEEIKNMPALMFLLKHLDRVSEQVKRALHKEKLFVYVLSIQRTLQIPQRLC